MIPYLIFLFIIIICLFLFKKTENDNYFKFAFFIIFIFAAFRGNGSGDYFHYLSYSNDITTLHDLFNFSFPMEFGFRLLSYVKNILVLPEQFIIIFMNFISVYVTYFVINKYSSNKILSTIIFLPIYLQFDMHATRSAVSAALGSLSFFIYKSGQYKKASLFFVFSILFHKSSVVLLLIPLYDFFVKKYKRMNYKKLEIFLLLLAIMPIFRILENILKFLSSFNNMFLKLYNYIYLTRFSYPISFLDPRVLLSLLIFIISLYLVSTYKKEDRSLYNVHQIAFLNVFFILIFHESTFLAFRFSSFFDRILVILIPYLISNFNLTIVYKFFFSKCKGNFNKLFSLINIHKNNIIFIIYLLYYIALSVFTMVPYKLFF